MLCFSPKTILHVYTFEDRITHLTCIIKNKDVIPIIFMETSCGFFFFTNDGMRDVNE